MLTEEILSTNLTRTAGSGSRSTLRLTSWTDRGKEDVAIDMLDAEIAIGDEYTRHKSSSSDDSPHEEVVLEANEDDDSDAGENPTTQAGHKLVPDFTAESGGDSEPAPPRSKCNLADVAYHMVRDKVARGDAAFYFLSRSEMAAGDIQRGDPRTAQSHSEVSNFWAPSVVIRRHLSHLMRHLRGLRADSGTYPG